MCKTYRFMHYQYQVQLAHRACNYLFNDDENKFTR